MTYDDDDMDKDGWYNQKTFAYANYKILPGDSVMLYAPNNITLRAAGEVKGEMTPSVLPTAGWYLIGNSTPVEVPVQSLVPQVSGSIIPGARNFFYILDGERKQKFTFGWMTYDDDDMDKDGWYNQKTFAYADYKIKPGESIMFYAAQPMTINWPNPLPSDK